MKRFGKSLMALVMAVMLLMVNTAAVAEKNKGELLLDKVLRRKPEKEVQMGSTMVLDFKVLLPIPIDWEIVFGDEKDEELEFQCIGSDEEGRQVFFAGMIAAGNPENPMTIAKAQQKMDEARIDHFKISTDDFDMLLTGNDEAAMGVLFSTDGKALSFGFSGGQAGLDNVLASEKLLDDIAAVLDAIWVLNPEELTSFSNMPEEETPAQETPDITENSGASSYYVLQDADRRLIENQTAWRIPTAAVWENADMLGVVVVSEADEMAFVPVTACREEDGAWVLQETGSSLLSAGTRLLLAAE